MLDEVNLQKVLHNIKINKVSDSSLENTINVDELGKVLKSMKNNKSPGIDGITADFLKVFLETVKNLYLLSIKFLFHQMSVVNLIMPGYNNMYTKM